MSKKKKSIIIVSVVLAILLLAGIGVIFLNLSKENEEVIAAAENTYNPEYVSFCSAEQSPDITIDGVLDESVWQDKNWFEHTYLNNVNGTMPRIRYTAFPTQYGVYVASVVEDTNLIHDGQNSHVQNSNFEFNIAAFSVDEESASDNLFRRDVSVDMQGFLEARFSNVDRAVTVDGEINSGKTKGATLEVFIPWDNFQVDLEKGIPKEIYMLPTYRAVLSGSDTTQRMQLLDWMLEDIEDYYLFDENGYTTADAENCVVGDSKIGYAKSGTWDISKEGKGIVQSSSGIGNHKILFKDAYGTDFIVETTIVPVKQQRDGAMAGIYFQKADEVYSKWYAIAMPMGDKILVDSVNGTKNFPKYSITTRLMDGNWHDDAICDIENSQAASREGVKLTVIKHGKQFWYFVDGKYVTAQEIEYMDASVVPGLYAYNADAIFKNYSCKEIEKEELYSYLNKHGVYYIDVQTKGNGGSAAVSKFSTETGGSYALTLTSKTGYRVASVLINGKEKLSAVKKSAVDGVYTVSDVKANQEIVVTFEKCKTVSFKGKILLDKKGIRATMLLTGITNKELRYEITANANKGFDVQIPTGKYQVQITADNCKTILTSITINKDTTKDYNPTRSDFVDKITVNGNEVSSSTVWEMEEMQNRVSSSFTSTNKRPLLYFRQTGSNFAVSTTVEYTTEFKEGFSYQPDLMGGFFFNDGKNTAWIVATDTGVVYTGWKREMKLIDYNVLLQKSPIAANFAVAKQGDKLYLYFDGTLVKEMDWATVAPNIDANAEIAIGLYGIMDKNADIRFSNWSIQTGTEATKKYVNAHKLQNQSLEANPIFAKVVGVNGQWVKSAVTQWDLTQIANGIAKQSYSFSGTMRSPLYFSKAGKTALIETTISYTTDFKDGVDYQPDLFGGFCFSDGTNTGWLHANYTGIVYTGWKREMGFIKDPVLTCPEARSVKFTLAVKDGYAYIYFDDVFIAKKRLSVIVPGLQEDSDLAFGLRSITDKEADIQYSNISFSTDINAVNAYISAHKK